MRSTRWFWALCAVVLTATPVVGLGCAEPEPPKAAPPPPPPPPPDTDGDGFVDAEDKCPTEKEDNLPPDPKDGCPSTDLDNDGVANADDKCPNEAEDGLPPDAKDGCKTTDPDKDGIAGAADKCPNEPETVNDFEDEDGCPDVLPKVRVKGNEVQINDKIMFAVGKSTIDPKSEELIKNIAEVMNQHPEIEYAEIAGHADKQGNEKQNATLTKQRAQAVVKALAKLGVLEKRMHPEGYGSYCPIDKADSEAAYEKNRRVEVKIMRLDGKPTNVALGCEEAEKHKIKPAGIPKNAPTKDEISKAIEKAKNAGSKAPAPKAAPAPKKK